jgi:phosphoglycerate dehydrogenase-like enzyme
VCNNKGINADAVAEQTILLMLGLLRRAIVCDCAVRRGKQIEQKEKFIVEGIRELSDCRVGLVGLGDIAKAVALRLSAFGCEVFYWNRRPKDQETEKRYCVSFLPLDELVRTCDIISLHVPVTPETTGMVDAAFLGAMKRDALLINTARGDLVDNGALCSALCEGTLGGAGLDTIAPEPVLADHPLLHLPGSAAERLIFSPHIGGVTGTVFRRAHKNIWKAFEAVANGETPQNIVTDHILDGK